MTMIRQSHLDEAIARGIITTAQAQALSDLAVDAAVRPHPSDERFVVVNNFNEVFVAIGVGILIAAAKIPLGLVAGQSAVAMAGFSALVSWGLAEFFVFRRRMMLPSIVASLSFAYFVAVAVMRGLSQMGEVAGFQNTTVQIAAVLALAAALLRFRVPFLVLPLALAVAAMTVVYGSDGAKQGGLVLTLAAACGLVFLGLAVRFDLSDPARLKRASQFAFWLYVAGSPLTVHPLFWTILGHASDRWQSSPVLAAVIIPVALLVSLFGLVLDRRSPVVSTLAYVAVAIGLLLGSIGTGKGTVVAMTLAFIGLYVIMLGVGWRSVRRAVLARLPLGSLATRLPPVT